MIRSLLRSIGLYVYLKYVRKRFFPAQSQIAEHDLIEAKIIFYKQFIKPGDLCFDIGANIGNRTEVFLKMGSRVVAVEPQKECSRMLKMRFGKNIILVNKALGDGEREGVIYKSDTSEISSMSKEWIDAVSKSRFSNRAWNSQEHVKITTLDNLINMYGLPEFCKIDVEGYEQEVLKGLSKPIPFISFEYTIPEKLNSIEKCFLQLQRIGGFECNYTMGENMDLALHKWVSKEDIMEIMKRMSSSILFGDIYVRFAKSNSL